ncbi:hypothetical protein B0H63DRAFT_520549 [Podospora didyma]|uniref:Uncharacterized protein n=1 Tax=Podospora didyma TaxID=330526 RepID=A0AAE0U0H5_9PEZI|nr:hypothetical protein B0H63DRAFT_520549 [Podospora didyma]
MVTKGAGNCLDLQELSAADSPRTLRPWLNFGAPVRPDPIPGRFSGTSLSTSTSSTTSITSTTEGSPQDYNVPLKLIDIIANKEVTDALMDVEVTQHCARPLLAEFFSGKLRSDETDWWAGNQTEYMYDDKRNTHRLRRGPPRSRLPSYWLRAPEETPHRRESDSDSSDSNPVMPLAVEPAPAQPQPVQA